MSVFVLTIVFVHLVVDSLMVVVVVVGIVDKQTLFQLYGKDKFDNLTTLFLCKFGNEWYPVGTNVMMRQVSMKGVGVKVVYCRSCSHDALFVAAVACAVVALAVELLRRNEMLLQ